MEAYITILFFIFGTIFGSFYNVVGSRLPNGESIVKPRSHCTNCNHELQFYELIPLLSFLIQGAKCRVCKAKLSWSYFFYEFATGLLFAFSYLSFGFSWELLLSLTFMSALMIVIISDIEYFIIPDEVIVISSIMIVIELFLIYDLRTALLHIVSGACAFIIMYLVKCFGDFLFKKESMGGGDIKLLFVIGLVIGFKMSIITIFLASIIGLPISVLILWIKKTNIIPFGPFLSIAAMILFLLHIDFPAVLRFILI